MIKLDGKIVSQEHFPDNSLRIEPIKDDTIDLSWMGMAANQKRITWYYENDAELFTIIC